MGEIRDVKANLRAGMTLTAACDAARYGRGKLQHQRRLNPRLNDEIKALIKANKRKPRGRQHLMLADKKVKKATGSEEFWEKWDDSAASNRLVKDYSVKLLTTRRPAT